MNLSSVFLDGVLYKVTKVGIKFSTVKTRSKVQEIHSELINQICNKVAQGQNKKTKSNQRSDIATSL